MVIPKIDESQIIETKENIRNVIDRLISCYNYLIDDNNEIRKTMKIAPEGIEQVAKDQLIIPMLRALGYKPEFENNHLEIWAEANIGKYSKNPTTKNRTAVDYAVFIKDDREHLPRLIIEAKAIEKENISHGSFENPGDQLNTYYRQRDTAIYLSILFNGFKYSLFKRKEFPKEDGKSGFSLSEINDKKYEITLTDLDIISYPLTLQPNA